MILIREDVPLADFAEALRELNGIERRLRMIRSTILNLEESKDNPIQLDYIDVSSIIGDDKYDFYWQQFRKKLLNELRLVEMKYKSKLAKFKIIRL